MMRRSVPWPRAEVASTRPPWSCTTRAAMGRPSPTLAPGSGAAAVEGVVETVQILGGETHPVIGDGEDGPTLLAGDLHPHLALGLTEVEGVLHEVLHRLEEALPVSLDEDLRSGNQCHPHPRQLGAGGQRLEHLPGDDLQPEGPAGELHLPRLQTGEEEQVVEHPQQSVGVALGDAHPVPLLVAQWPQALLAEHAQVGLHRGERLLRSWETLESSSSRLRSMLFRPASAVWRSFSRPCGVLTQPSVFPGPGDLGGQRLQQRVRAILLAAHQHQDAERAMCPLDRQRGQVGVADHPPLGEGLAHRPLLGVHGADPRLVPSPDGDHLQEIAQRRVLGEKGAAGAEQARHQTQLELLGLGAGGRLVDRLRHPAQRLGGGVLSRGSLRRRAEVGEELHQRLGATAGGAGSGRPGHRGEDYPAWGAPAAPRRLTMPALSMKNGSPSNDSTFSR